MSATYPSLRKPGRAAETASAGPLRSRRGSSPSRPRRLAGNLRPTGADAADRAVERSGFPAAAAPPAHRPAARSIRAGDPGSTIDPCGGRRDHLDRRLGRPGTDRFGHASRGAALRRLHRALGLLGRRIPPPQARTVISLTSRRAREGSREGGVRRKGKPAATLAPRHTEAGSDQLEPTFDRSDSTGRRRFSATLSRIRGFRFHRDTTAISVPTPPAQVGPRGRLDDRSAPREEPARRAQTRQFAILSTLCRCRGRPRIGRDHGPKRGCSVR